MATDRITLYDVVLAPLFIAGACYFAWNAIRDIRRGECRPPVTYDMIDEAFEQQLMARSDGELAEMDWEDGDDD